MACEPGRSFLCSCASGASGTQVCERSGVLERCICPSDDAGLHDGGPAVDIEDARLPEADARSCVPLRCEELGCGVHRTDCGTVDCGACDETTTWFLETRGRDLAWDPERELLYVSVAAVDGAREGSLVAIDPVAREVAFEIPLAGHPGQVEISDDASILYVALGPLGTIQEVDLGARAAGAQFPTDREPGRRYGVSDFAVLARQPHTVVAALTLPGDERAGIAVFDHGVMRPSTVSSATTFSIPSRIEASSDPTAYGYYAASVGDVSMIVLDPAGATGVSPLAELDDGFGRDIRYEGGLVFSTSGHVIDPGPPARVERFAASGIVASESATNRTYFVTEREIIAFDRTTRAEIARIGAPAHRSIGSRPAQRLVRWGAHGLAYLLDFSAGFEVASHLVVITTNLVAEPR